LSSAFKRGITYWRAPSKNTFDRLAEIIGWAIETGGETPLDLYFILVAVVSVLRDNGKLGLVETTRTRKTSPATMKDY